MAFFSSIKRMHKQSKEHSSRSSGRSHDEKPAPYKHTPTHAASDAINGTPGGFGNKDRHKIREENRKRSALAAAHAHAHHMSMPGVPQGGSGMSSGGYSYGEVTPAVSTPDAYGHSASSSIYTVFSEVDYTQPRTRKGKEVDRGNYFDLSPLRPSTNQGGYSSVTSSRNSLGPQEGYRSRSNRSATERPTTIIGDVPHRLHPSSRRSSDASEKHANAKSAKTSNPAVLRDSRPPPSIRKFMAIPTAPQIPPLQFSGQGRNANSPAFNSPGTQSSPQLLTSRRNSSNSPNSLPSLTQSSSRVTSSTPSTPTRTVRVKKAEFTMLTPGPRVPSGDFDFQFSQDRGKDKGKDKDKDKRSKRRSTHKRSSGRYDDHSYVDSSVEQLDFELPPTPRASRPQSMTPSHRHSAKPAPPSPPSPPPSPKHRRRRFSLSRTGSKLLSKRWSGSSKK